MQELTVIVIIATFNKRTEWLIHRSLFSVYNQDVHNSEKIKVFIIDDNKDDHEIEKIRIQVGDLRKKLGISEKSFKTLIFKNQRTPSMSGTGAWNTGIAIAFRKFPDSFVSLLDDDDEYLPNHLEDCISLVRDNVVAVFQRLVWQNFDGSLLHFPLESRLISPQNFFIGNPGIQASNLFVKTEFAHSINGFDENLPNTSDRDFMIRFLWAIEKRNHQTENQDKHLQIEISNKIGVIYHNHVNHKVNNDFHKKQIGLDYFYQKYRPSFSESDYLDSIERAQRLFKYQPKK